MAELFTKPNSPFYYCDFSVGDERVRKSTRRTNKREARAVADQWEREALDRQQLGVSKDLTLEEALGFWVDHHRNNPKARAAQRVSKIMEYTIDVPGMSPGMMFHELTSTLLRKYQQARLDMGVSKQTINHEINAISAAYNIVKEDYRVRPSLKFPRFPIESTPRPFLDHEVQLLLDELDPDKPLRTKAGHTVPEYSLGNLAVVLEMRQQNYDLVVCLLDTGLRLMELTRVTWDIVNTKDWSFQIERTKTKDKSIASRHRFMDVQPTARVRAVLERRYKTRGNNPYVFPAWKHVEDGRVIHDVAPQKSTGAIRKAINAVGLNSPENVARWRKRDVRSLRDTYATRLSKHGVPLDQIQELLGHTTPVMTQKYRDAALNQFSANAASILDSLD